MHFQALSNMVTSTLLEDPVHPGRLRSFDGESLEVVILLLNPHSQITATLNWSYLSPMRRQCMDLADKIQELVVQKLPSPSHSVHPLLRQLEAAKTHLQKVLLNLRINDLIISFLIHYCL
jgi:hypothetical protein